MKRTGLLHRKTRVRRHGLRHLRDARERAEFRVAVLRRARGRCERCGSDARLDVHHIVPRSRAPGWSGLHEPENGAALCRQCHDTVHAHIGDWRTWLRYAPRVQEVAS